MGSILRAASIRNPSGDNLPVEFSATPSVQGIPLGYSVEVDNDAGILTAALRKIVFTGNGVSASYSSGAVIVNISGGTGGSAGATNLNAITNATTITITSSTGNSAIIPAATTSVAGTMTAADKVRVNSIESLAADATGSVITNGAHSGITASYNSVTKTLNLTATAQGSVTNLSTTYTTSSITVLSSTGNDAIVNEATPYVDSGNTGTAGVMSSMDKYNLNLLVAGKNTPPLISVQNIGQESGSLIPTADMHGKLVRVSTTTVPFIQVLIQNDATNLCPVGTCILFSQAASGQLQFTGDVDVVLNTSGTGTYTAKQFAKVTLTKVAANTWEIDGNLGTLI